VISANAGKYLPRKVVTNYRGCWKGISAEGGKRLARNAPNNLGMDLLKVHA
jgi:hypothetical protein